MLYSRLNRKYFISARHGRKPQNCRWNFDTINHSSRDISISGLGGPVAISGCRSLLLSFGDTFFDVAVVAKLDFVTWITTILILDLFWHISQHDIKILPVSKKNSHVFNVMPNNLWCTNWRPGCCILYPLHIQEKSRKDSAQCWAAFFYSFKNWAGGFFTPKRNTRVNKINYYPQQ